MGIKEIASLTRRRMNIEVAYIGDQYFINGADSLNALTSKLSKVYDEPQSIESDELPFFIDWMNSNGFAASNEDGELVLNAGQKKGFLKWLNSFQKEHEGVSILTYYQATVDDYRNALKLIGIQKVSAGNTTLVKFAHALMELMSGAAEFDLSQPQLMLFFRTVKVPVTLTPSESGVQVRALGVFPQESAIQDFLESFFEPALAIKIMFPTKPKTSDKAVLALTDFVGIDNIQEGYIPEAKWTKAYPLFHAAQTSVAKTGKDSDLELLKMIEESFNLKSIPGIPDDMLPHLMNDGSMLVPDPEMAASIAAALNAQKLKAKVGSSRYGTTVDYDSKKVYKLFNK